MLHVDELASKNSITSFLKIMISMNCHLINLTFFFDVEVFGFGLITSCTPSPCNYVNDGFLWFDDEFDIYL